MKLIFLMAGLLFFMAANAHEDTRLNYIGASLKLETENFGVVSINLKNENDSFSSLVIKSRELKVVIGSEELKKYKSVNLNDVRFYENISPDSVEKLAPEDRLPETNVTDTFGEEYIEKEINMLKKMEKIISICIEYGDFKSGFRAGKEGYYQGVLLIEVDKKGKYKLKEIPVKDQSHAFSPCI